MILEKWQCNVTTSIESWSPLEAFAGYAIEGALDPLLSEMNGSEEGWVLFPGRAGGEGHKRRLPYR
ncbi:hypothetical protein SADUNF_SadunfMtG0008200 (mitochondrion) [Salix dunnii]|uniref:Uncharacterized protein n=1 Tax=Salix dunnii TaxID=1413687 RepID=A0A835J0B0_9ROSI|nr:hypothetical protein SADUNF_SadunfMtG0008200 [Salix dunnii]